MSHSLPALPLGKGVRVLATHECGLIALDKPEGVMSHPNEKDSPKATLLKAPYNHQEEYYQVGDARVHLLHRLDAPTSGVILVALSSELAEAVRRSFRERSVEKHYVAVVGGMIRRQQGVWSDSLSKERSAGRVRAEVGGGNLAKASFQFVAQKERRGRLHLLKLMPHTGRTHQLRIQCQKHGYPIVGDKTYGDFKLNTQVRQQTGVKRLCLHAESLGVSFLWKGRKVSFNAESPMPKAFDKVLMQ